MSAHGCGALALALGLAVLGLVWTPCVGPTLGATITLASQGESQLLGLAQLAIGIAILTGADKQF